MFKYFNPAFLTLFLVVSSAFPAFGIGTKQPADAPQQFFQAVSDKKYQAAWDSLTKKSQLGIVKLVVHTEKKAHITEKKVFQLFKRNDRSLQRGFWTEFRASISIKDWMKQRFELTQKVSSDKALVKALPSEVELKVWKEKSGWKFGYIETFISEDLDKVLEKMKGTE